MSFFGDDEATQNREADDKLIEDQDKAWGDNRVAVEGEWLGLVTDFGGEYAPLAIVAKDGFESMTHQQIWDQLQGVNAGLINDKALAWRALADLTEIANQDFLKAVNEDLNTGWNGQSGTAAVNGVREFSNSLIPLVAGFRLVAHGLDLMETYLGQAKASVGEPDNVTNRDKVVNFLLEDDFFKTPQYRADEAQDTARRVMTTYYEPGAERVDRGTPVLPEPAKPVDDGSKPPGTDNPGGPTTNGNGTDTGTSTDDGTKSEDPGQQPTGEDPQSTEPQSTEPQSTTPETTTPQSTTPTTPSLTTGTPTTPGTPAGTPSGTPSGTPQTTVPLIPGQTVPGGPGKPAGTPAATVAANTSNRAGRTGMPGMMSPGAARGNREDDDEHETPDYLIYDRGSELLGTQPPALPPGGVIGG